MIKLKYHILQWFNNKLKRHFKHYTYMCVYVLYFSHLLLNAQFYIIMIHITLTFYYLQIWQFIVGIYLIYRYVF